MVIIDSLKKITDKIAKLGSRHTIPTVLILVSFSIPSTMFTAYANTSNDTIENNITINWLYNLFVPIKENIVPITALKASPLPGLRVTTYSTAHLKYISLSYPLLGNT